jgi:stage II sporulation protein D
MRLPTTLLACVLALLVSAPAQAASRLTVRGGGFGHGIGMSQYGALGFAQHGKDHAFILGHYYTGTRLDQLAGPRQVRVLLQTASRISFSGAASVSGARALNPRTTYRATRRLSGSITLRTASGKLAGTYPSPLTVTGSPSAIKLFGRSGNATSDGRYRGALQIRAGSLGGLNAINQADLEDYVRGVVAGESPSSWPAEALRAQAVAARTYAITTAKSGRGFDQYADTRSQVYNGISGERATTDAAVAATRNEVVTYNGKPVVTYYSSSSGGRTENIENAFLGAPAQPWLKSVDDPYDDSSPRHKWVARMSLAEAERRLGRLVKGSLRRIRVLQRGQSPRVVRAQIVGSRGSTRTTGPVLQARLHLFSTWARFTVTTASGSRGDGNEQGQPAAPAAAGETSAGGAAPG